MDPEWLFSPDANTPGISRNKSVKSNVNEAEITIQNTDYPKEYRWHLGNVMTQVDILADQPSLLCEPRISDTLPLYIHHLTHHLKR